MYTSLYARRRHLVVLVVLTLACGVFWWRLWTPSAADRIIFAQDGDFSLHYYAPMRYQMERAAQGELAQWNPYNRAGFPHIGNIQNSTFYPIRYLVAAVVPGDEWTIETLQWEIAVHIWLSSVLMYAFLLSLFHGRPARTQIAVFGALLWSYSGYLTSYPILHVNILETVTWLPLALLGTASALYHPRWQRSAAAAAVALALMALAGHPQVALYMVYLVVGFGLYTAWRLRIAWRRALARLVVIGAIAGGLAAIQLLPALELMRLSSRVTEQSFAEKSVGFSPSGLADWLWPNGSAAWSPLYVGPIGLLLAAAGAFAVQARENRFWMAAFFVGLFFTFGGATVVYAAFYVFAPGISIFRHQERGIAVAVFALVVLASYGLAWLSDAPNATRLRRFHMAAYGLAGVLTLVYLIAQTGQTLGATIAVERLSSLAFASLIAGLFVVWLETMRGETAAVGLLCALLCADLLTVGMNSPNYRPDTPQQRLTLDLPLEPYRIDPTSIAWRVDGGAGLQGAGDFFRVPDIYGVGPFSLASIDGLYTLPVDRFWEIFSVRYATIVDPPPPNVPLDLLAYGRNRAGQEYQLVELLDPRPLAHLVYDYRAAEGSSEFARQIMADPNINLREQAITLFPLSFELPITRPPVSRVEAVTWESPEKLSIHVSTGADALLTLSIVNYPGWHAMVDGQPVEIVDTYAGLIGVPVQTGEDQVVEVVFQSRSLAVGAAISLAVALAVVGALFFTEWRKRPSATEPPSRAA